MTLLIYLQRVGTAMTRAVVGTTAGLSDTGTPVVAVASMVTSKAFFQQ